MFELEHEFAEITQQGVVWVVKLFAKKLIANFLLPPFTFHFTCKTCFKILNQFSYKLIKNVCSFICFVKKHNHKMNCGVDVLLWDWI